MATTHEVRWSVSATPVAKESGDDGGTMAHDTIHENIRKTLGGSGTSETDGAISQGGTFTNGVSSTPYLQADNSTTCAIGDGTATFIYVKHTGYLWSSASVLGNATTDTLKIYADSEHIATLNAGEAWIIPVPGSSDTVTSGYYAKRGGSSDIAVEAIGMD
tara:strand:- start:2263 stop:2745 length:483 start_codon:yes stop_codon:yes gene_type:complete